MRIKATRLPLNDVAHYWAREAALLLDGLSLQTIRSDLFTSLRDDDMAIAQPLREEAPRDLGVSPFLWVHTATWGYPLPITGELLGKVMVPAPGATTESRKLDDYNEVSRKVWFDEVTVDKEGFGFWCDDHGHQRPEFWFGKLVKAVSSSNAAATACTKWMKQLVQENTQPVNKAALWETASAKFPGLSQRSFNAAWSNCAPKEWRLPGRKSVHRIDT